MTPCPVRPERATPVEGATLKTMKYDESSRNDLGLSATRTLVGRERWCCALYIPLPAAPLGWGGSGGAIGGPWPWFALAKTYFWFSVEQTPAEVRAAPSASAACVLLTPDSSPSLSLLIFLRWHLVLVLMIAAARSLYFL
eukprot:scaffold10642_cov121-Isochrysis_galbana.AAC.2